MLLPGSRLLTDRVQRNVPPVRVAAVFENVDALPRAEGEISEVDGDRQLCLRERGANMSGHVVGAFGCVSVEGVVFGDEAAEETFEIAHHVGVSVFLNRQGSRSVLDENSEQTRGEIKIAEPTLHLPRDFVKPLPPVETIIS